MKSALALRKLRQLWNVPADTVPRPTVSAVVPSSGAAGISVTLTGTGYWYPDSKLHSYHVYRVTFDDVDATEVVVTSATTLTCKVPATVPSGGAGFVNVWVWGPGGQSVGEDFFFYLTVDPIDTEAGPPILTEAGDDLFPE